MHTGNRQPRRAAALRAVGELGRRRPAALRVGVSLSLIALMVACTDLTRPIAPPNTPRLDVSAGDGPTVSTDREDYAPGETVAISGWSWEPGETVRLQVVHVVDQGDGDRPVHQPWDVTANANGAIASTWLVPEDEAGASLKLTADGQTSGAHAEVLFTDLTGTPVVRLYATAYTITRSAYPWGATIYPRLTTGTGQRDICYRIRWFNPSDVAVQTTIVGKGSTSYDPASFTIPATGPSGTWYVILDENNGALDCNTATYGGASNRINFDVARAVVVGAGTTGSDATGGDQCVYAASIPPGSGCSGATVSRLWVSSQVSNILRSFVRFDLSAALPSAVPAGAAITNAQVRLVVEGTPSAQRTYNLHRVTASWSEATLTSPGSGPAVAATATDDAEVLTTLTPGNAGGNPQTWVKWDATADVQGFLDGAFTNYGWRVSDKFEGSGNVQGRFHTTENTGGCDVVAGTTCERVMPVLLIDYVPGPTKLAFTNAAFTGRVGACLGPFTIQSQDDASAALAVTANTTVSLSSDNGGTGAGGFYSNNTCTTSITSVQINSGSYNSSNFYYRATGRGDGTHELTGDDTSPNRLTSATQTQTINKALTTLTYTGDPIVLIGNTLHMKAVLTSDFEGCISGKTVIWALKPNPLTGAIEFWFPGNTSTNSLGLATKDLATTNWIEGIYDGRANFPGDANCEASKDDPAITVLAPGNAATGGGFLAGSKIGGGRANFGFNVRPVEGSDPTTYKGQFLLIKKDGDAPVFRCKGYLDLYGVLTGSSVNYASGKCDFQVWNPALAGGTGDWEVPAGIGYANRPFVIQFVDNGTGSRGKNTTTLPDEFGFSIDFVGSVANPSFARAAINGGDIDVKADGSSATSDGGTKPGGGKKN